MVQYANYSGLLTSLPTVEEVLDDHASELLGTAIGAMSPLRLEPQGLMQMPTEDGSETAGPTFEYFAPARTESAR